MTTTVYQCIPVGVADRADNGQITAVVAVVENPKPAEIGIVQVGAENLMLPDISPRIGNDPGFGCTLCYNEADDTMQVCDDCGFMQHVACQDRWGLHMKSEGENRVCCYCSNDWMPNAKTGYAKIATERSA